jgi:surface antigen
MQRKTLIATAVTVGIALAGCTTDRPNEQAGMIIGGALGGLLGNQVGSGAGRTAAVIVGTLAGVTIGGAVGRSMDDTDRLKTAQSLENVRTGVSSSWRNPDTGNQYTVIPTRTYDTSEGPCREYTVDALIDGRPEKIYGTACRQPDGSWRTTG